MKFNYLSLIQVLLLLGLAFFIFKANIGYYNLSQKVFVCQQRLFALKSKYNLFTQNISLFSGSDIDFDLLETQARHVVSFVYPDENAFFWKENSKEDLNVYYG